MVLEAGSTGFPVRSGLQRGVAERVWTSRTWLVDWRESVRQHVPLSAWSASATTL